MDEKFTNPFLDAIDNILGQFGIVDTKKGKIKVKENMTIDKDITAFVGLVGEIRGNVSYSFNNDTAKKIVSIMMMGMPVNTIDDMARSAIAELSNMITGNAVTAFDEAKMLVDITPPSVIMGEDIFFVLGSVTTTMVNIETSVGEIEINFGLEI